MTGMELYVRLLTELSHHHADRRTFTTRLRLQDALCELRGRAAVEQGDSLGQETQDEAESQALSAVKKGENR